MNLRTGMTFKVLRFVGKIPVVIERLTISLSSDGISFFNSFTPLMLTLKGPVALFWFKEDNKCKSLP